MGSTRDFDGWAADVSRELQRLGISMMEAKHIPYDNEDWFRREFDGGEDAGMTASEWVNNS